MRRKKHKHTRRALRFYRITHGFRPPYKASTPPLLCCCEQCRLAQQVDVSHITAVQPCCRGAVPVVLHWLDRSRALPGLYMRCC